MSALLAFDRELCRREGVRLLCGADEAGRGPLCGPVIAGAVILPEDAELPGLNDSKKLSEKRREALYEAIQRQAVSWAVGRAEAWEIDRINILNAALLAMRRAVDALTPEPEYILLDGNTVRYFDGRNAHALVKGDGTSACVAAASILAKVTRDRELCELDRRYPGYGFAKHKGYPTKAHYEALNRLGPTPEHRRSFLKKWEGR